MTAILDIDNYVRDGAVNSSIYTDPDIFELEMEKIFENHWVYVGHESEIAQPGDYKTTYMGRQPVIVTRGADDHQIHVLLNRCTHRGASVCQTECGNANFFRCAYHGWTFSNDGRLTGMPFQDGYGEGLNKEEKGLKKVPRVESYNGFIFASFNENIMPLEEHLGNARQYLDYVVSTGPEGISVNAGAHKYTANINWKFQFENSADPYHLSVTHRSFFDLMSKRTGKKFNFKQMHENERVKDLGNGHSLYELAGDLGIGALPFNLLVFPNLAILGSHIRTIFPVTVDKINVTLQPFLLKGVSKEENAARLRKHENFYGPAGHGTVDDLEVAFDRVREGLQANQGGVWLDISRGLHRQQVDENGIISSISSDEVTTRAFYKAWKKVMSE